MKYTLSILIVFLVLGQFSAQNKKVDKLEMYYDQGNFKIVLRKSSKLLRSDEYKTHPSPHVFHALAEYQLSKNNDKFSSATAVYDYEKFLELDSTFYYQKVYANYIYDLQIGIADEIRNLSESGEEDKAKVKYDTYNRIFENVANYEELVTTSIPVNEEEVSEDVVGTGNNEDSGSNTTKRKKIIKEAKKHIGTPYSYGGVSPKGFDCSGFTQYVFSKNGTSIPRTASVQATTYEKVKLSKVKPGDLVFFGSGKNNISHVGIVVSNGGSESLSMIHASSSRGIMISNVDNDTYWKPKLQYAVRIIK